jgi:hypothetical protein
VFEKDLARLMNISSPWKSKENTQVATPPGLNAANEDSRNDLSVTKRPTLAKSKSQPKVAGIKSKLISFLEQILSI